MSLADRRAAALAALRRTSPATPYPPPTPPSGGPEDIDGYLAAHRERYPLLDEPAPDDPWGQQ